MRSAQVLTQPQSTDFLPQIESLLQRMSLTYLRDFALDLIQVAQPDKIGQLVADWEVTLEEIEQAGDELDDILTARFDTQSGIAINKDTDQLHRDKLDAETAAFEHKHPWLKKHYLNQFIAMHNGEVVDSDADFEPLCLRVQAKFGDIAVLIQQVRQTPIEEFFFRSPRLEVIG